MKYFVVRYCLVILSFLPLKVIRFLGSSIGAIAYKYSTKSRQRTIKNLLLTKLATIENVDKMALNVAKNLGQTLLETLLIAWCCNKKSCYKLIREFRHINQVQDSVKNNRPIIFLTPHIGNFEIIVKATAFVLNDSKFTIIVKPSKNKLFNQLMYQGRVEDNIIPVPTNKTGVISLIKALRNHELVGILPDSVASQGDGVWVDFFGQKVFATTLSAKMIQYQLADIYIANSIRVDGGFILDFIKYHPTKFDDTKYIVEDIYRILESIIKDNPEQYFWSYDRFRVPSHASKL